MELLYLKFIDNIFLVFAATLAHTHSSSNIKVWL